MDAYSSRRYLTAAAIDAGFQKYLGLVPADGYYRPTAQAHIDEIKKGE